MSASKYIEDECEREEGEDLGSEDEIEDDDDEPNEEDLAFIAPSDEEEEDVPRQHKNKRRRINLGDDVGDSSSDLGEIVSTNRDANLDGGEEDEQEEEIPFKEWVAGVNADEILNEEALRTVIETWKFKLGVGEEMDNERNLFQVISELYGYEDLKSIAGNVVPCSYLQKEFLKYSSGVAEVVRAADRLKRESSRVEDQKKFEEISEDITKIIEVLSYTNKIIMNISLRNISASGDNIAWKEVDLENKLMWLVCPVVPQLKMTPLQEFIRRVLNLLADHKYMREGEDCVSEMLLDNPFDPENGPKIRTRYPKKVCSIAEFIYKNVKMDTDPLMWSYMTARGGIVSEAVNYLKNCSDFEFPEVMREMRLWTMRNGVYDGNEDVFYPFNAENGLPIVAEFDQNGQIVRTGSVFPASRMSCVYINADFPFEWACRKNENFSDSDTDPDHWKHIPTENFDKILNSQGFDEATQMWFWVFRGRAFFYTKERENWQVMLLLRGAAGTGKTCIVNNIKSTHPIGKVGTLSSNVEPKFGLSQLVNTWSVILPELRSDSFDLDFAEFLQAISADPMSLAVKHENAIQIPYWLQHMVGCCNIPIQKLDMQGALARRVVEMEFVNKIPKEKVDPMLEEKIMEENPRIILKSIRAYMTATREYGNQNIWAVLPESFQKHRTAMERRCNPLEGFLHSGLFIFEYPEGHRSHMPAATRGNIKVISVEKMKEKFAQYCKDVGRKPIPFDEELYTSTFKHFNIRLITGNPNFTNQVKGKFFSNICLDEDTDTSPISGVVPK